MSDLRLFTSESVTEGHPDKICDQISDSILDAMLAQDPHARVAVETLVTTGLVHVAGEVSTVGYVDIPAIVRQRISGIGYDSSEVWFDGRSCGVEISLGGQSPDIAAGVDTALESRIGSSVDELDHQGAGDQGIMFGYAVRETPQLMPLPIWLAHRLAERLAEVRKAGEVDYLRPDGKTQVTVGYDGSTPRTIEAIVLSAQHSPRVSSKQLEAELIELVIRPVLDRVDLPWENAQRFINPTGRFEIGGPQGDAGLTGRKIIVDTYGGAARHGGGAFSGKDPSKVDRSAAYAMRWVAKNVVASGLADRVEVQVAYAIGTASPVGLYVETFGTATVPEERIIGAIREVFDLRPAAIIRDLDLLRPIYAPTATYGHFGRELPDFTWERTDRVDQLRSAARGVTTVARVLVDSSLPQLDRLLDYRLPPGMEVTPGVRVSVPLRSAGRRADGFVVEVADQQDFPGPLSDIAAVVSPVPVLRPEVWRLARAVADRAAGSASDVLRHAIPPRQVRVEKAWLARSEEPPAPTIAAPELPGYPDEVTRAVAAHARLALRVRPGVERIGDAWVGRWASVIARLVARTLAAGESAIVVMPDYRDEEQIEAALAPLVPASAIVRWGAAQTNAERYRGMLRAAGAAPAAVIGTRSAIYAPAERLGLIVVWDDGDPLLAEPLAPYVHARDAALIRQEQQGSALVLAGHTRTTDVERLVELGWVRDAGPSRVSRPRVIPTANIAAQDRLAAQARIPSIAWREASQAAKLGPVLVQVGRPGYAPGLRCADCGQAARCRRCGGPLRQTRAGAVPSCGWCGAPDSTWRCANCGGARLRPSGAGATRTAEDLGRAFPGVRIVVSDGERTVREVGEDPAIVIATRGAEPIAAGGYRAVLLLDGERMVARASLRVGEDVLRWWTAATALAADDAPVVLVGVGGALATAMVTGDTAAYARAELADRRGLRFPPAVRMATLQGRPEAVAAGIAALPEGAEVVGTTGEGETARSIIRFDYAHGAAVATALRAEVIRQATARRPPGPPAARRGRRPLPLKVHLDDADPFGE